MTAPKTIYLLRKSIQGTDSIPVLSRTDLPLRFHFKGKEINIEATPKGNLIIKEARLAGINGK